MLGQDPSANLLARDGVSGGRPHGKRGTMRLTRRVRAPLAVGCLAGLLLAGLVLVGCSGGPPEQPADEREPRGLAATPSAVARDARLDWTVLPAPARGESVEAVSGRYVVSHSRDLTRVVVRRGQSRDVLLTYAAPAGRQVDRALLDPPSLVIVTSDPEEEEADEVVVVDLRSRRERGLAAGAPPAWRGPWSLGEGVLTYGTRTLRGRNCLAAVELDSLDGEVVECAAPRHGTAQVRHSPFGLAYGRWDDSRPFPCTTLRVRRGQRGPVDARGPVACRAWEAVAVEGGLVWSEVPRPRQPDVGEVFVDTDTSRRRSLGYGTPGSLTWCGDYVWFVRQMGVASVMRWSADAGLETAFEADSSESPVLTFPICSGDSIAFVVVVSAPDGRNREVPHVTMATR